MISVLPLDPLTCFDVQVIDDQFFVLSVKFSNETGDKVIDLQSFKCIAVQ